MSANQLTDVELFSLLSKGSQPAFKEIFHRYYLLLVRIASKITGDAVFAQDLANSALLDVWRTREAIAQPECGRPYLISIVRNLSLNHLRNGRRRLTISTDLTPELPENTNPEQLIVEAEMYCLLTKALKRLTPGEAEVVSLLQSGKKVKEIAKILGTSEANISQTKGRAYIKLERCIR